MKNPPQKLSQGKCYSFLRSLPFLVLLTFLAPSPANAVPAFARQTGQACSACHIGAFGPQLTAYGRSFKLNGYVWGDVKHLWDGFSGMAYTGIEHTQKKQASEPQPDYPTNNTGTLDQASLFYGGRLLSNVGIMAQGTYSLPTKALNWDNTDVRFADITQVGGKDLLYGITANNNPTVQDVWQSTPAWGFPYAKSSLAPAPATAPFIASLAQRVVGAGAYTLWDDWIYAELSGYTGISDSASKTLGMDGSATADRLNGFAPYWRLAVQHDFGPHYVSIGTYGLNADRYPGNVRGSGTDNIRDYAVDATYQFASADNEHKVSIYGSYLREFQRLDASVAATSANNLHNHLNALNLNTSYYYDDTYGITVNRFSTTGSADAGLYPDSPNNKPNSSGWMTQLDWTPFGKDSEYDASYLNARIFLQYVMYNTFDGTSKNYDGTGRNASDNNTVFLGTWLAF